MNTPRTLGLALVCALGLAACSGFSLDAGTVCDGDVCAPLEDDDAGPRDGGEGDGDLSWTDADGDIDADADADAEMDYQGNPPPEPVEWEGRCGDGVDDSPRVEGLTDCDPGGCQAAGACCQATARSWVQGDFSACDDVETCGWVAFAGDATLARPWVILSGNAAGDVGLATAAPVAELHGGPLLTFAASLDPACAGATCRQLLGVALTAQETLEGGAGVLPALGLVLDGEQVAIHLVVAGRVEATFDATSEELTGLRGYALRLLDDGVVELHRGLPVDEAAETPVVGVAGEPELVPTQGRLGGAGGLRVAVFGDLDGGTARVGAVGLERPVCDDPAGFLRVPSPSGATAPGLIEGLESTTGQALGGPTVVPDPWVPGSLLMIFEEGPHLGIASSPDGATWERRGELHAGAGLTEYGEVALRAPTVVVVRSGSFDPVPVLHLWYEGVSQHPGIAAGGLPRAAIVHATSVDGFAWLESPDEGAALTGDPDARWRLEVGEPSVTMTSDGNLVMAFVGTNTATGETAIGIARSPDGRSWVVDQAPLTFEPAAPLPFERDGVSSPHLASWGSVIHLWYAGTNGSTLAIGHAFASGDAGDAWTRYGEVLAPSEPWEARRVRAPAVMLIPIEGEDAFAELLLWYEAGTQGRERIGLATRELPAHQVDLPVVAW